MTTFPQLFGTLTSGEDLSYDQCRWAMDQIMTAQVPAEVIAGFLMSLATKGETPTEIRGMADGMLAHAVKIELPSQCLDIVGTGGDGYKTANISTMASLVLAASGVAVVKHGNRASTSACGSADVLEQLGINLGLDTDQVAQSFQELGITFLFANVFHPAMRFVAPVRKALGYRTVFNILGPLTNPAAPQASAVGVAIGKMAALVADVFKDRGSDAWVFRGKETGLDELNTVEVNQIWEVHQGQVQYYELDLAKELGLEKVEISQLRGADAPYNAQIMRQVLDGQSSPIADAVLLNAAGGMCAYNRLPGTTTADGAIEQRLKNALEISRETIRSGKAAKLLDDWIARSHQNLSTP